MGAGVFARSGTPRDRQLFMLSEIPKSPIDTLEEPTLSLDPVPRNSQGVVNQ